MNARGLIFAFFGTIGAHLSGHAATMGFEFSVLAERDARRLVYKISYEGLGAWAARRFEKTPSELSLAERTDAFRYCMANLRFVQAERLALEGVGEPGNEKDGRKFIALGMARLCRGDFEGAVASFTSAEASGHKSAAEFRVPIACLILGKPDGTRSAVKRMVQGGEFNTSAPAAKAILAYCQVASDGSDILDEMTSLIELEPIYLWREVLQSYVRACRKHGKLAEIGSLRLLYESRNGSLGRPLVSPPAELVPPSARLEVDIDFQTGGPSTERYLWLQIPKDGSKGIGARAAQHYESKATNLSEEVKMDALNFYLTNFQFVQAERLGEALVAGASKSPNARHHLALAIARLCRGDFERAVDSFQVAEKSGSRAAAFLHIYISSLVFRRPEEVQEMARRMAESEEFNTSRLAASGMLAYCHTAKDGEALFGKVLKRINRNLLSDEGVLNLYATLCDRFHKSDELSSLKPYLEGTRARLFSE